MIETFAQITSLAQHSFLFLKAYILDFKQDNKLQNSAEYQIYPFPPSRSSAPQELPFLPIATQSRYECDCLKSGGRLNTWHSAKARIWKEDGNEYLYWHPNF